jgi:hypothetical protein
VKIFTGYKVFCHSEDQAVNMVSSIFYVYCKNYAKPVNTLSGQSAEFLMLNPAVRVLTTGLKRVEVQIGIIILV